MKKKFLLSGLVLLTVFGLTACGNPLKSLPEVSDTNILDDYDEDNDDAVTETEKAILKDLEKEVGKDYEITSLVIYDRDDGEDKDKSDVYAEVKYETEYAEYTKYYVVEMKYNKDGKKWKVKGIEVDEHEDASVKVIRDKSDDEMISDIANWEYSAYLNDKYVYLYDEEKYSNFDVENVDYEDVDGDYINCNYEVTFTLQDGFYFYDVNATVTYRLYTEDYYGYEYFTYYDTTFDSAESYLDPSVEDELSEERMLEDFYAAEKTWGEFSSPVSEDWVKEVTFDDIDFFSSYCIRYMHLVLEPMEGVEVYYYAETEYDYNDSDGWYFDYCWFGTESNDNGKYYYITSDVEGTWEGTVTYDGDYCGDIVIDIDDYDQDYLYGTITFISDDGETSGPVEFESDFWSSSYCEYDFDLDESISYKRNGSLSYFYLYANPANGTMETYGDYPKISVEKQ